MITNIGRIFLMLGQKCNLQCGYCLQHDMINEDTTVVSDDVKRWLKKVIREQHKKPNITFYGGEPLVYWTAIKDVIEELGEQRYSIITNGKLLTEDKVDFLNDYGVSVAVSWDGTNVLKTRGYDVLNENPNILNVQRLSVSGVLSSKNYPKDFLDALETFMEAYYVQQGHYPGLNIDTIMDFGNCADLKKLDIDKLYSQMDEIIENKDNKKSYALFKDKILGGYRFFSSHEDITARCGNGISVWNVDGQGNVYRCHNSGDKIGTIKDNHIFVITRAIKLDPTEYNYLSRCKECPVQPMCRSGCPLIDAKGREEYYCDIRKAFYLPFIRYANKPIEKGREIIIG